MGGWLVVAAAVLGGCSNKSGKGASAPGDCRRDGGDDVRTAARTSGEAARTGGVVVAEGAKTVGKTIGGLFSGGADEAEDAWKKGKARTAEKADEGKARVNKEASVPPCPK
jgi:hypothetical protein